MGAAPESTQSTNKQRGTKLETTKELAKVVKKLLKNKTTDDTQIYMIYLDRHLGIGCASVEADHCEPYVALLEETPGPYWRIGTVRPATKEMFIHDDWRVMDSLTDDILSKIVSDAVSERTRFYKEREKVYGTDAWPRTFSLA